MFKEGSGVVLMQKRPSSPMCGIGFERVTGKERRKRMIEMLVDCELEKVPSYHTRRRGMGGIFIWVGRGSGLAIEVSAEFSPGI